MAEEEKKQKEAERAKLEERIRQREWIEQARETRRKEQNEAFSSDNDSYIKRRDAVRDARDEMAEDVSTFPMTVPVIHYKVVCESASPRSGNHYELTTKEASRLSKWNF